MDKQFFDQYRAQRIKVMSNKPASSDAPVTPQALPVIPVVAAPQKRVAEKDPIAAQLATQGNKPAAAAPAHQVVASVTPPTVAQAPAAAQEQPAAVGRSYRWYDPRGWFWGLLNLLLGVLDFLINDGIDIGSFFFRWIYAVVLVVVLGLAGWWWFGGSAAPVSSPDGTTDVAVPMPRTLVAGTSICFSSPTDCKPLTADLTALVAKTDQAGWAAVSSAEDGAPIGYVLWTDLGVAPAPASTGPGQSFLGGGTTPTTGTISNSNTLIQNANLLATENGLKLPKITVSDQDYNALVRFMWVAAIPMRAVVFVLTLLLLIGTVIYELQSERNSAWGFRVDGEKEQVTWLLTLRTQEFTRFIMIALTGFIILHLLYQGALAVVIGWLSAVMKTNVETAVHWIVNLIMLVMFAWAEWTMYLTSVAQPIIKPEKKPKDFENKGLAEQWMREKAGKVQIVNQITDPHAVLDGAFDPFIVSNDPHASLPITIQYQELGAKLKRDMSRNYVYIVWFWFLSQFFGPYGLLFALDWWDILLPIAAVIAVGENFREFGEDVMMLGKVALGTGLFGYVGNLAMKGAGVLEYPGFVPFLLGPFAYLIPKVKNALGDGLTDLIGVIIVLALLAGEVFTKAVYGF